MVLVKGKPEKPLNKARLTLTRHSSSEPDADGLISGFKHCIDALVLAGVLVNDKMSNVGIPTYQWMQCPPGKGHISMRIEEI